MREIRVTGRKLSLSETVRRLNPHLLGAATDTKRQPNQRSAEQDKPLESRPSCVVVTIISLRRRLVDGHDNLRTGAKPLVDRITETLGFASDDDPHIRWEYAQVETRGEEGTIVRIQEV